MPKLRELAKVLRSKNAGAFVLTFDIMFEDEATYQRVKRSGVINRELFSRLYHVPVEQVDYTEFDLAYSLKASIPRAIPSGDADDTDVYGAQQHAPLMDVEIP